MKKLIILTALIICVSCKKKQEETVTQSETKIVSKVLENINLSSGTIQRIENFPSDFVRPRNVDVWLPENYSKDKKYAVLYMHDGQMLFDASTTWNKQEWRVDEVASQLMKVGKTKDFIVVAMWNHADIRHPNYYPQKPFESLPEKYKDSIVNSAKKQYGSDFKALDSDNYLKFIVEEVKPYIDSHYSVKTDARNTFVAGSSMGGLISMYALCEYPNVFGGSACLSTHWVGIQPYKGNPIPETFFKYLEESLPSPKTHKIYFDYGTATLDKFYLPYQHRVDEVLKLKGFDDTNSKNLKFEGHAHDEISWAKRLDVPLTFLLKR